MEPDITKTDMILKPILDEVPQDLVQNNFNPQLKQLLSK